MKNVDAVGGVARRIVWWLLVAGGLGAVGGVSRAEEGRALTAPEVFVQLMPRGEYSAEAVARLEKIRSEAIDVRERAVAELGLLAQQAMMGSPVTNAELREKLTALAAAYPDTWIAVQAKTGLLETYSPHENMRARLALLESMLADGGLAEMARPGGPYLVEFMKLNDGPEIARSPRDFVLSRVVYEHTTGYDLATAEVVAAQITQPHWREFAERHLAGLRKMSAELREKRRAHFLKNQKG